MESKLLCGGKNIVDHTNEQQRALDQRRQEIAEQKVRCASLLQATVIGQLALWGDSTYVHLVTEMLAKQTFPF